MTEYTTVATTDDVEPGECTIVDVAGETIALVRTDEEIYAIENTCSHQGGSLGDGMIVQTTITCPLHGSAFNLASGEALGPPADEPVSTYDVVAEDGEIRVSVEE